MQKLVLLIMCVMFAVSGCGSGSRAGSDKPIPKVDWGKASAETKTSVVSTFKENERKYVDFAVVQDKDNKDSVNVVLVVPVYYKKAAAAEEGQNALRQLNLYAKIFSDIKDKETQSKTDLGLIYQYFNVDLAVVPFGTKDFDKTLVRIFIPKNTADNAKKFK